MKNIPLLLAVALLAAACSGVGKADLRGTAPGLEDAELLLKRLDYNTLSTVDTLKTGCAGEFSAKVPMKGTSPEFYYLYSGETQLAALVLMAGDKVSLEIGKDGYRVSGSEESLRLQRINADFNAAKAGMDSLLRIYGEALDGQEQERIRGEMGRLYVDYKRKAVRNMMENPSSIASVAVAFQRFSDQLPVFSEDTDFILLRQVCDSLTLRYPLSGYVKALRDEAAKRENRYEIVSRMEEMEQVGFPDLDLPDINGEQVKLSDSKGKVIILSFWSAASTDHKVYNHNLIELYSKYHDAGLEIYQVCLDPDKPSWAATVKGQKLPWISVNDGMGTLSPARLLYNIDRVPTLFLIDRGGEIVARDIVEPSLLEAQVKKYL